MGTQNPISYMKERMEDILMREMPLINRRSLLLGPLKRHLLINL
jgi:hypothetical protein